MTAYTDPVEFRGSEIKSFKGDDGKDVSMTVFRFDDESGVQNEFFVSDLSKISGVDELLRGGLYSLGLDIRRNNKVRLISVESK